MKFNTVKWKKKYVLCSRRQENEWNRPHTCILDKIISFLFFFIIVIHITIIDIKDVRLLTLGGKKVKKNNFSIHCKSSDEFCKAK